ncbi:MAG TPA: hypothetical protein PKZ42_01710 [Syntrophales bacterium]|nr:hypothetical protein [Syntrophales bacterium]
MEELKTINLQKTRYIFLAWRFLGGCVVFAATLFAIKSFSDITKQERLINIAIIAISFAIFFIIYKTLLSENYLKCPYCSKSVLIKTDWQCPYCNQFQGKDKHIWESCVHCKRLLETAYCEHCHKEFKL